MKIRTANSDDIDELLSLIQSQNDKLLERDREELEALLPTFYVAEAPDGTLAGCSCLEIYSKKIAELRSVAVLEAYRNQGIGKLLVARALEEARKRDIHEVLVVTSDPAFFERMNFSTCLDEKYALFWNRT